ncbi:MAG TPA: MBL fold metallo-hydrolase [Candidatus Dormibacteraeota bacterium]|nr:MBL fold metallo-hydrolase [Candidatus Dormibacteraeota bacterium]
MTGEEGAGRDPAMLELAILGSGSAFSALGHNSGYLVDGELLLDCGAPVTLLMGQLGRSLADLKSVAISHLHGDHVSQLPLLLAARAARYEAAQPLQIIGPVGTAQHLATLGRLALGDQFWDWVTEVGRSTVEEWVGGQSGALGAFQVQAFEVEHSAQLACLGFGLERHGITLGYSGDTSLCPGIRQLAASVSYLLCECTSMSEPAPIHLWKAEVEQLIVANPTTRFILTHLAERTPVKGAILAADGLVLQLRPIAPD